MEAEKNADNDELTSTSVPRMDEASSINKEEKNNCPNDSLPTSSTDANTSVIATEQVSDDPISSTSSELDSSKPKSNMSLNIMDNSSVNFDPDAELFGMSVNVSNEKIEENVDDLVSDLETLLGESADSFSMASKSNELHGSKDPHIIQTEPETKAVELADETIQEESENCPADTPEPVVIARSPITEANEAIEIHQVSDESELANAEIIQQEPIVEEPEVTTNIEQANNDLEIMVIEEVDSENKDDAPVSSSSKLTDKNYQDETELEMHSATVELSIEALPKELQSEPIGAADTQEVDISVEHVVAKSSSDVSEHQPEEVLKSEPLEPASETEQQNISVDVIEAATDDNSQHQQDRPESENRAVEIEQQNIPIETLEAATDNESKLHQEEVSESEPLKIAKMEHIDIPVEADDSNQKQERRESEKCDISVKVIESSIDKQREVQTSELIELPEAKQLDVSCESAKISSGDAKGQQEEITELESMEVSAAEQLEAPIQAPEASTSDYSKHEHKSLIQLSETEHLNVSVEINKTSSNNDSKCEEVQEADLVQLPQAEELDEPIENNETSTSDDSKHQNTPKSESVQLPEVEHMDVQREVSETSTNDHLKDQPKLQLSESLVEAAQLDVPIEVGESSTTNDSKHQQEEQESKSVQITETKLDIPTDVSEISTNDTLKHHQRVEELESVQLLEAEQLDVPFEDSESSTNDDSKHQQEEREIKSVQITQGEQLDIPTEGNEISTTDTSKYHQKVEVSESVQLLEAENLDVPFEVGEDSNNDHLKEEQEESKSVQITQVEQLDVPTEVSETSTNDDTQSVHQLPEPEESDIPTEVSEVSTIDDSKHELMQESEMVELPEPKQLDAPIKVIETSVTIDSNEQQDAVQESELVQLPEDEHFNVKIVNEISTTGDLKGEKMEASEIVLLSEAEETDISMKTIEPLVSDDSKQPQEVQKSEAVNVLQSEQLSASIAVPETSTDGDSTSQQEVQKSEAVNVSQSEQLSASIAVPETSTDGDSKSQQEVQKSEAVNVSQSEQLSASIAVPETSTDDDSKSQQGEIVKPQLKPELLDIPSEVLTEDDSNQQQERTSKLENIGTTETDQLDSKDISIIDLTDNGLQKASEESESEPLDSIFVAQVDVQVEGKYQQASQALHSDGLDTNSGIAVEIFDSSVIDPFSEVELPINALPLVNIIPDLNVRRKTVEQDLEKVVCLSEESSDSDSSETVRKLEKPICDIKAFDEEVSDLIKVEVESVMNPEPSIATSLPSIEEVLAVQPEIVAESNLESILALDAVPIPEIRTDRSLSEKEIREREVIRMAVASITDSPQDVYDAYLEHVEDEPTEGLLLPEEKTIETVDGNVVGIEETKADENILETATNDVNLDMQQDTVIASEMETDDQVTAEDSNKDLASEQIEQQEVVAAATEMSCEKKAMEIVNLEANSAIDHTSIDSESGAKQDKELVVEDAHRGYTGIEVNKPEEETSPSEMQLKVEESLGDEKLKIKGTETVFVATPEKLPVQQSEDRCSKVETTKEKNLTDNDIQIRLAVASISGTSSTSGASKTVAASNNSPLTVVSSNTKTNKAMIPSDLQHSPKNTEKTSVAAGMEGVESTDDFVLKADSMNKKLETNIDKKIICEDIPIKSTIDTPVVVEEQKLMEMTEKQTADKKIEQENTSEEGAQCSVIRLPKVETVTESVEPGASISEEFDHQILQEKRPRSRSRKVNKISEPLSITVDEIDKAERKEKVYSPKITIKPLKAPEEEVSTTSDAEGNKGSLKMTITKQSATLHSILKVYNPEEDTDNVQSQGEPIVPKIIIKQKQGEQQHSPKMSTRSSKTYSPTNTRCSSPRMTIKTKCVDAPKEIHSPIKITLKSIKTQDDDSPKAQDQKNFMVKPTSDEDSLGANPRLTLKVKRHADDAGIDYEPGRSSPKITIKPVIKPANEQTAAEQPSSGPKLKIKTGKKHDDEDATAIILQRDQGSPKVLIKTFVKSYDGEDDDESKERIVLKINKGSLPIKESKKREYPDDDKLERQGGIKMKFSTTGGQMHIIQESEDVGSKRQRKDSGYVGGTVLLKKDAEEMSSKRPLDDKTPEKNKRLKNSLGGEDLDATTDPFKNDRLQGHLHADNNAPQTADISKIVDLASRTTHIESTSVMTVGVATPTVQTPPAPKRRGRPRKVPLQVREELPQSMSLPETGVASSSTSASPFSTISTPEATPSPGGRPKRSCRGQNVIATLGIKPRKPRGRGRGAKVNMGDRVPAVAVPTEAPPAPTPAPMTAVLEKVHKPPVDAAKEVTLPVHKEENLDFSKVPPYIATETAPSTSSFVARDNFSEQQFNPLKRKADSLLGVEEKRLKVDLSSFSQDSDAKQSDDSSKDDDKVSGEEDGDSGDESATEKRKEWALHRKQEAIKKCRAKRMEKLARVAEQKKKRREQVAQQREARKAAEAAEKSRATKRYGRYGIPKPQISLIDEPVRETAGTIKGPLSVGADIERVNVHPVLVDEDNSSMDKDKAKVSKSLQKNLVDPLALDLADDTARSSLDTDDVVMLDEDTRMSADFRGSRSQTPAKAVLQPDLIIEDSQGSIGTEGGRSRSSKAPKMEVFQDFESAVFMADQLAEYSWNGQGPFMLQEQVAQFLGIKSFKRKYPNITRRPVEMQERDYLKENGLASEALCDLGLTAVVAQDILDIMYADFQEKYEEYCRAQREKQVREFANKQKALSQYVLKPGYDKMDILEQAVQSAAAWNLQLNKTRREERRAQMDLQSLTIHYPKSRMKPVPVRKIGHYPIALVPGQFTDYYKEFTPTELNNLPLNTMCYDEIKIPVRDSESDRSGSESDSDSDSSSSSSTSGSSCDEDNCKECTKRETNGGKEMDSDDVVVIENDASSSDSVVLVSVSSASVPA